MIKMEDYKEIKLNEHILKEENKNEEKEKEKEKVDIK